MGKKKAGGKNKGKTMTLGQLREKFADSAAPQQTWSEMADEDATQGERLIYS